MKLTLGQVQGVVYDKKTNNFGQVVDFDIINSEVTIKDVEDNISTLSLKDAKFLELIGVIGENVIIDGDVLVDANNTLYEIELQKDNTVLFHLLGENQERIGSGKPLDKNGLEVFAGILLPIGNINDAFLFEDEDDALLDFNVKIMKDTEDNTYFYACYNEEEEVIDLIKVVFIGANLLEEGYTRTTLEFDEYLDIVKEGLLVESSPSELQNYAYQLSRNTKSTNQVENKQESELCFESCDKNCKACLEEQVDEEDSCVVCEDTNCDCKKW